MSNILIKTVDLTKVYKTGSEEVVALNHVNLEFKRGEVVALSGASGSGKTTLLNLIGSLDSITSGDILFDGASISSMNEKEKTAFRRLNLGFIFQSYNLIPVLTAYENVEMAFKALSKGEIEKLNLPMTVHEACLEVLKDVGLTGYENRRPGELSGGQQQRVSIARALVRRPSLILADEPTANLDSNNSLMILKLLSALNEKYGMTVIYSSHDQVVLDNVHRVVILKDGAVVEDRQC